MACSTTTGGNCVDDCPKAETSNAKVANAIVDAPNRDLALIPTKPRIPTDIAGALVTITTTCRKWIQALFQESKMETLHFGFDLRTTLDEAFVRRAVTRRWHIRCVIPQQQAPARWNGSGSSPTLTAARVVCDTRSQRQSPTVQRRRCPSPR